MLAEKLQEIRNNGKRVLIIGLGISGITSARFLSKRGIEVLCVEKAGADHFWRTSKFAHDARELQLHGVPIHFGIDGEAITSLLERVALVVLSPGVPLESSIVGAISRNRVPYVSELELGVELHGGQLVVVTGSNGKSTTVSLIDHILRSAGMASYLCGNVGTPVIASPEIGGDANRRSILVVEASSYQLEACTSLQPKVAVMLNISENHLERHGSLERYAAAKARALRLQDEHDIAVLNIDDPIVVRMCEGIRSGRAYFGTRPVEEVKGRTDVYAEIVHESGTSSRIRLLFQGAIEEFELSRAQLLGLHNRYNMAAAVVATRSLGVSHEKVQAGLLSFSPLTHRLEMLVEDGSVRVINDSKSTTVAAAVAAFSTITDQFVGVPVTLMIGGLSKAGSWDPLLSQVQRYQRSRAGTVVICFGKDGPLLANHCRSRGVACHVASNLREATVSGLQQIQNGGVLLLSPGCASFDEFTDFEDRGDHFRRYINELFAGDERDTLRTAV